MLTPGMSSIKNTKGQAWNVWLHQLQLTLKKCLSIADKISIELHIWLHTVVGLNYVRELRFKYAGVDLDQSYMYMVEECLSQQNAR